MNRTLAQEWQYVAACGGEAERAEALPAFMERCNWEHPHSVWGLLPTWHVGGANNLLAHNTTSLETPSFTRMGVRAPCSPGGPPRTASDSRRGRMGYYRNAVVESLWGGKNEAHHRRAIRRDEGGLARTSWIAGFYGDAIRPPHPIGILAMEPASRGFCRCHSRVPFFS